jgi:beta-glucosidase-like glycosyl hydrolase
MRLLAVTTAAAVGTAVHATTHDSPLCSQNSEVVIGTNYVHQISVKSVGDCCAACYDYGYNCKAYTFDTATSECFLKDNINGKKQESGRISGTPTAGPRPPSPNSNKTVETRACQPPHDSYLFCNVSFPLEDRVDNLISLLKTEEIPLFMKARLGGGGSPGPANNISRIGLPEYDWGVNCIHGVQTNCLQNSKGETMCPTSFPNPNALGASFNASMWRTMGSIIGVELRALWLAGATEASTWSGKPHAGLDCWSPNVNINRDPRWGRNQEVASEDPYINGIFGKEYTIGLQEGEDDRFIQAISTLKHWDAYSLEDSDGYTRHNFDAKVSNYTLADTYFPAFKASVMEGKAHGVMCSYNSVNGVPTCANSFLDSVLRNEWNFDGYITSDTGAVADIYAQHHYRTDGKGATCAALKDGGCDIDSGKVYSDNLLEAIADPSKYGCNMDDVHVALHRTLGLRFRLGLFDPIEDQPYWHVSADVVNSTTSQNINQQATRESMVLLQNDLEKGLPFDAGSHVAVIGPHSQAQAALVGNYLGQICPNGGSSFDCVETPLDAITRINGKTGKTTVVQGCEIEKAITGGIDAAVSAAKAADSVVLILGISEHEEGESHDRTSIDLPQPQHDLARAVLAANPTARMAVVLVNGGMVAIAEEKETAPAIVEAFYPGFWGGSAIAETLFGLNENLGGKLPFTIYPANYTDLVSMSDMQFAPHGSSPGRSYRYYTGSPTYPAFTGLSLTTFKTVSPTNQSTQLSLRAGEIGIFHSISVTVTNIGNRTGDEVVFLFVKPPKNSTSHLIRKLAGFERVHLAPEESTTVNFNVSITILKLTASDSGDIVSSPGVFTVDISTGPLQSDIVTSIQVHVMGSAPVVLEAFPRY